MSPASRTIQPIAAQARREKALVLRLDQTGIRAVAPVGATWAPVGKTPMVAAPRTPVELELVVRSFLHQLQKLPERIRSYFGKPDVRYAA